MPFPVLIRIRVRRWTAAGLFFGVAAGLVVLLIVLRLDGFGGLLPGAFFGGLIAVGVLCGAAILGLVTGAISHLRHRDAESAPRE
jgi:hypothetical protein